MAITSEDIVRREVFYCVSALVSTLASSGTEGYGATRSHDMAQLWEQARELSAPILDYEEAAEESGWRRVHDDSGDYWRCTDSATGTETDAETAEEACGISECDPYEFEVFEHWIVSDWLADKLAEHGEKVDKDFAGMTIWARTTTGQGIASDWVIEEITREVNAA